MQFRICSSCKFEAARTEAVLGDLREAECLVCGYRDKWFDLKCLECEEVARLNDGGEFTCGHCGHRMDQSDIVDAINEFEVNKDNYFEARVPANCAECDGYHSVVEYKDKYLCVMCFYISDDVEACGFCSEFSNGDMEDSYLTGCSVCEGAIGWQRDKDD